MTEEFEPKILGFLCRWCYYIADLAGIWETRHPPNSCMTRAMCSCTVNELSVLEAFAAGADGVLIAGCLPEECPCIKYNLSARRRIMVLEPLLEAIGVGSERMGLEWISASDDTRLVERFESFAQTIKQLGPSPLRRRRC